MSPTESDLRNALRDGEGDQPDVDHVVSGAQAARSLRQTRILSTAAAVVLVAGAAVGGAALVSHNGGNGKTSGTNDAAAAPARAAASAGSAAGGTVGSAASAPVAGPAEKTPPATCPPSFPHTLLAGGGSPGQFGASGKLFAKPVRSIVVCSYTGAAATTTARTPGRTVLTGAAAQTLASSLENALKTPTKTPCPDYIVAGAPSLAIIAVSTDGTVLPTVTTTLGRPACHTQVSNGTVVRYGWSPPSSLSASLSPASSATKPGSASTGTGGSPGASGTPLH